MNGIELATGWIVLIVLIGIIELILKGIGLWKAARLGQKGWYIVLLILNTAGILPLIYIFAVARPREERESSGGA